MSSNLQLSKLMRPIRNAGVLALAAVSVACAQKSPAVKYPAPKTETIEKKPLEALWIQGKCSFNEKTNELTYTAYGKTKSFILDSKVEKPTKLACSDLYSAVVTNDRAFITLGAEDVFSGHEYLGHYGGKFTWSNTYYIELEEEPVSARMRGTTLVIDTKQNRTWSIDVSDPHGSKWTVLDSKEAKNNLLNNSDSLYLW